MNGWIMAGIGRRCAPCSMQGEVYEWLIGWVFPWQILQSAMPPKRQSNADRYEYCSGAARGRHTEICGIWCA